MESIGPGPKVKGLAWLFIALLLGGTAALTVPVIAKHVPWSFERRLAKLVSGSPEIQICGEGAPTKAAALFEKVVQRVYRVYPSDAEFPVQIKVIRGKTVNAFAFLGGQIFVYEGLLKQTESAEELAGILAHEIEHVKRRHIIQGVFVRLITVESLRLILSGHNAMDTELAGMLLNMRFTREEEQEADEGALRRLRDARIDPSGFQNFFKRAGNMTAIPTILSDHPANESRARMAEGFLSAPSAPIMSKTDWDSVKTICQ